MKRIFALWSCFILLQTVFAQEFKFTMYFEDAMQHKDSVVIGYDSLATLGADALFDEVDIINSPLDSLFDVRLIHQSFYEEQDIHTIKQILPYSCEEQFRIDISMRPVITVGIKSSYWPVTASWDNTLFNVKCREGSLLTSFTPGGWWDVAGGSSNLNKVGLASQSSVTFSSNLRENTNNFPYYGNMHFEDTLSYFWVAFGDTNLIKVNVEDHHSDFKIYPNPATGFIYFEDGISNTKSVQIISPNGKRSNLYFEKNKASLANQPPGLYIIMLTTIDNKVILRKLLILQ